MPETLAGRIKDRIANKHEMDRHKKKRWRWTLEAGKGSTYSHGRPTLYAHSVFNKGSVMEGRPERLWFDQWETWEEARKALTEVKATIKTFAYDDFGPQGGSSHVPLSIQTAGIPDEPDLK